MISEMILTDHRSGEEFFAVAGNSPFQGTEQRQGQMVRFRDLWAAHNAMVVDLVLPKIVDRGEGGEIADVLKDLAGRAEDLLARLSERADAGDAGDQWILDFRRLKETYEDQCRIEAAQILPAIGKSLPPAEVAQLTHRAMELRRARGA